MKKNISFAKYKRSNVYTDPKPNDPKYIFTVISDMIKQDYNADNANFLDIGGANGDFSNYIQSTFPKFKTTCLEPSKNLIKIGKKYNKKVYFINGNTETLSQFEDKKYNFVTAIGLIGILDSLENFLTESLRILKENGSLFICENFNDYNIDVITRYKRNDEKEWNTGQNIHSKNTIKEILKDYKNIKIEFKKITLPFDLKKNINDPVRSWTEKNHDEVRELRNGLGYLINLEVAKIKKF